jgi:alpha-beta hydrolase superfamily lysophospholipase
MLYRAWLLPQGSACRGITCLVHGLGGHSQRWEACASYLKEKGVVSYALELPGFGEHKKDKGHVESFRRYYREISALIELAEEAHPGAPLFLIGESFGALLAFHFASVEGPAFQGVICLSPAFKSTLSFTVGQRAAFSLAWALRRRMRFRVPFSSALCTRDKAYQSLLDHDPREVRTVTAAFLWNTLRIQRRAWLDAQFLRIPVFFQLAGMDQMVDNEASRRVFRGIAFEDKALKEYPGMRHALSIDEEREKVFADMYQWMLQHGVKEAPA